MDHDRGRLLGWIDEDRDAIVSFLSRLTRAQSPNPPGDTREAAQVVAGLLEAHGIEHRVVALDPLMPNVMATFEGSSPGQHVVLNGHLDVFPCDPHGWTVDPWGGEVREGRVYGRGVNDMKAGTTASLFAFIYLHRLRDALPGRSTLTAVSDEERFGPNGARFLIERHPEVLGDVLLNAEPTGLGNMRFGEKAPLWITFTCRTPGAHGAYAHKSRSATKIVASLILDLERLTDLEVATPPDLARLLAEGASAIDAAQTPGASGIIDRVTVNAGVVRGGLKVNMIPGECTLEVDIRVPVGLRTEAVIEAALEIAARHPEVSAEVVSAPQPRWSDPNHPMVALMRANSRAVGGVDPLPVISLPGTDARLWREHGVPAFVYGITPHNVAMADEYVEIEEMLHVLRTHVLSAYDFLLARGVPAA